MLSVTISDYMKPDFRSSLSKEMSSICVSMKSLNRLRTEELSTKRVVDLDSPLSPCALMRRADSTLNARKLLM
jgi:hypothetical protein